MKRVSIGSEAYSSNSVAANVRNVRAYTGKVIANVVVVVLGRGQESGQEKDEVGELHDGCVVGDVCEGRS